MILATIIIQPLKKTRLYRHSSLKDYCPDERLTIDCLSMSPYAIRV